METTTTASTTTEANSPHSLSSTIKIGIINSIVKGVCLTVSFFLGIYLIQKGFSGAELGIFFASSTITNILTIIPSGISNDRFKSKNLIWIGLILIAIQNFGKASIASTATLPMILLFIIGGFGNSLYVTSADSFFFKSTEKTNLPIKISLFQIPHYLTIGIGLIIAGYFLNKNIQFETIFKIGSAILVFAAIASYIILPSNKTAKFEALHYKKDIFKSQVLIFIIIAFLLAIHFGAEFTNYSLFLQENLNLNKFQIGLYMGTAIILMAPAVVLIAKYSSRIKIKNIMLIGLIGSGLGHILMTINIVEISWAFRIVHEIADAFWFFFLAYGISKLFDLERVGGNSSIFSFTSGVGSAIGALMFGPIGTAYGQNIPLIISGATTLLGAIIAMAYLRHFDHD